MVTKTVTVTVGDVDYELRTGLGWFEREGYDAGQHAVIRATRKEWESADDDQVFSIVPDPRGAKLRRLEAWLVSWTGCKNPKRRHIMDIPFEHVPAIMEKIDELEKGSNGVTEDSPLDEPSTNT